MKTLNSQLSAALFLPATLLLCQCVPTGSTLSPHVITVPTSARPRANAPAPAVLAYSPLGGMVNEALSARGKKKPQPISAEAPASMDAGEPQLVVLGPLIVTDDLNSMRAAGMKYWPVNIHDADEKKSWITFPQPERRNSYPMGETGLDWMKSLR